MQNVTSLYILQEILAGIAEIKKWYKKIKQAQAHYVALRQLRYRPLSTEAKFSEKLTFLPPKYVCVSDGKKC